MIPTKHTKQDLEKVWLTETQREFAATLEEAGFTLQCFPGNKHDFPHFTRRVGSTHDISPVHQYVLPERFGGRGQQGTYFFQLLEEDSVEIDDPVVYRQFEDHLAESSKSMRDYPYENLLFAGVGTLASSVIGFALAGPIGALLGGSISGGVLGTIASRESFGRQEEANAILSSAFQPLAKESKTQYDLPFVLENIKPF